MRDPEGMRERRREGVWDGGGEGYGREEGREGRDV